MLSNRNFFVAFFLAFAPWIAVVTHLHASLTALIQEDPTINMPQPRTVVQEIIDVPQERTMVHSGEEPDNSFAACLLIMDDNHVLIEWLAYHYNTLPLRRLIVAVDPASQTSPSKILDRYRDRGLMNITEWGDDDFMPLDHNETRQHFYKLRKPSVIDPATDLHRDRQSYFIGHCLATLKNEGADWVIHIDTDEYIIPNYIAQDPYRVQYNTSTTIYDMLQQKKLIDQHMGSSCITLPRLQIGTKESNLSQVESLVPTGFNASHFQTLRWRWRAKFENKESNGNPKAMVDVSRIRRGYLRRNLQHNPHRPVTSEKVCPMLNMFMNKVNATFLVHHYGGTWEQWSFRQDPRREKWNRRTLDAYQKLQGYADGETDHIRPWLPAFVRKHGQELASALLEGVGEVPSSSPY
jgi:hypothetical protein